MRETLRVHGAAIEHELPQCASPASVKKARGPRLVVRTSTRPRSSMVCTAGGIFGWFRLSPPRQVRRKMPSATQRVLAEMAAQLATQQVALGRGERGGGAIGSAAHRRLVAGRMTPRD